MDVPNLGRLRKILTKLKKGNQKKFPLVNWPRFDWLIIPDGSYSNISQLSGSLDVIQEYEHSLRGVPKARWIVMLFDLKVLSWQERYSIC